MTILHVSQYEQVNVERTLRYENHPKYLRDVGEKLLSDIKAVAELQRGDLVDKDIRIQEILKPY